MAAYTGKDAGKEGCLFNAGGVKTGTATMEISVAIAQKVEKSGLRSSSTTLGCVPVQKYVLIHVIVTLLIIARNWKWLISCRNNLTFR